MSVANGPESDREKRVKLMQIIDSTVDVDGIARFCLGRFWRNASAEQQQRYTQLFHQVLVNNISAKLGEYRGVRYTMGRAQQRDETAVRDRACGQSLAGGPQPKRLRPSDCGSVKQLTALGHTRTKVKSPQTNGICER